MTGPGRQHQPAQLAGGPLDAPARKRQRSVWPIGLGGHPVNVLRRSQRPSPAYTRYPIRAVVVRSSNKSSVEKVLS